MILGIIVAIIGIIALMILHELGHFIIAKKFGVDVEEFGIGYPPRILGKKFGDTLYSINIIPFGAFVKIKGEEGGIEDIRSFSGKPIWQRMLIVIGGVASFWIISAILLGIVAGFWGLPTVVSDDEDSNLRDSRIQIVSVLSDSPAESAELQIGDVITKISKNSEFKKIDKISDVQNFTDIYKGENIILFIDRVGEMMEVSIIPRISYPKDEGPMGIGLARIALKPCSWFQAPIKGIVFTGVLTSSVVNGWIMGLKKLFGSDELPPGMKFEVMGPLGILGLLREYFAKGINYFLYLISLISVALALANILPIPALDGGKLVFLCLEAIRKKPIPAKIEQTVTAVFFIILISIMLYITIRFDIPKVF